MVEGRAMAAMQGRAARRVRRVAPEHLHRPRPFSDHLTRIEVHISDENAGKSGQRDKRCMMEARPAHQKPVAVTHEAATVDEACAGAAKKLRSLLETHFGKLHDVKGAASIRDNEHR